MGDGPTSAALAARLVRLAGPIAAGRLGVVGMGLVDTICVGQFAPHELAHQALGWTLSGPAQIGGIGLLLGVQVLVARAVGAGAKRGLGPIWRRGLVVALAAGALVCAASAFAARPLLQLTGVSPDLAGHAAAVAAILGLSVPPHLAFMASAKVMEALERPGPPAVAMWLANGVNLALNLLLTPAHGAVGSAWATVASRVFLALALPAWMLWSAPVRAFLSGPPAPVEAGYRPLLAIGLAAAAGAAVEAGAFAAMAVIAARQGGALSVTVWNIATGGLVTLAFLLAQGFATAAIVLASEAVGAGSRLLANRIGWIAIGLTALAATAAGAACVAFAPALARLFTTDPASRAALAGAMTLIAVLIAVDGAQGPADAVLRARGENWYPTAVRFVAFVGLAPALALGPGALLTAPAWSPLAATTLAGLGALIALLLRLRQAPAART